MAEKRQKPRDREGMCHGGEGHRLGSSGDGALAVEAVIGEPVSVSEFPVSLGKYREICRLRLVMRDPAPRISEQIQSVPSEFPKNRSREFR